MAMPIYWRNKIYSESEREELWLMKLDKQTRYVMGEKVDISKDEKAYEGLVKYYREINKALGYGSDQNTAGIEEYERQRRVIANETRVRNATQTK